MCVAVCCSVLQCVTVCCSVLQCVAVVAVVCVFDSTCERVSLCVSVYVYMYMCVYVCRRRQISEISKEYPNVDFSAITSNTDTIWYARNVSEQMSERERERKKERERARAREQEQV